MSPPAISDVVQRRVQAAAQDRCGYCLSSQKYVMRKFENEHLIIMSDLKRGNCYGNIGN